MVRTFVIKSPLASIGLPVWVVACALFLPSAVPAADTQNMQGEDNEIWKGGREERSGTTERDCFGGDVFTSGDYTTATIPSHCSSLSLSYNKDIAVVGVAAIAAKLKDNTELRYLNLESINAGDEGAAAIAEAVKVNVGLTELNMYDNNIGDVGATAIAEALAVNTALREVYLYGNNIGDIGTMAIAEALKVNSVLVYLDLQYNQIGSRGATAIAEALAFNKALAYMDLDNNKIGDSGATNIAEALNVNTALTELYLEANGILDESIISSIEQCLEKNNEPSERAAKEIAIAERQNPALKVAREAREAAQDAEEAEMFAAKERAVAEELSLARKTLKEAAKKVAQVKEAAAAGKWAASERAAVRAASIKTHHASLAKIPCGNHYGCERLLGNLVVHDFVNLGQTNLFDLNITSAVDLLAYVHEPGVADSDYYFVTGNADFRPTIRADYEALVEPLKIIPRRKFTKGLADVLSTGSSSVLAGVFSRDRYVNFTDKAAFGEMPMEQWARTLRVCAAAVAELKELGVDTVADFAFLESDDLFSIAEKLMKMTSFHDAWWFEHSVAYTLSSLWK